MPPQALAERDVEARDDDDGGADPGPQIGEITENYIAEHCRADQLDIAERRDDRGRAGLEGADDEVMPGTAKQTQAAEQQDVERTCGMTNTNGNGIVMTREPSNAVN